MIGGSNHFTTETQQFLEKPESVTSEVNEELVAFTVTARIISSELDLTQSTIKNFFENGTKKSHWHAGQFVDNCICASKPASNFIIYTKKSEESFWVYLYQEFCPGRAVDAGNVCTNKNTVKISEVRCV